MMSDETRNQTSSEDTRLLEVPVDWFLQKLVAVMNESPESYVGITLNVGGILVSGELISGKRYFEAFAKEYADGSRAVGLDSAVADQLETSLADLGRIYDEPDEWGETAAWPHFIHLRNAQFFWPGQLPVPMNRPVWWRGRIEAVDGFVLGSLSAE
jgi:hypothetical protein